MKIVVLDGYTLNQGERDWEELNELGEVAVHDRTEPDEVIRRAEGAEVVLTNKVVLDRSTIEHLPDLKYIGVLATGYNIIDLNAARERGIVVTNIPAYSTDSVVQMAFAHILNITLRVGHYAHEVHNGVWSAQPDFSYRDTPLIELKGKRIGLVGFGHIGQAMAKVALAFGMKVVVCPHKMDTKLPKEYEKAKGRVDRRESFGTCFVER